jgi:ABC-type multidrug transport system fused ATPase/permease subunit
MRENKFDPSTVIGAEFSNGRRLSGGETQLVALAASLSKNGKLMILDEPTSRLDPDSAQRVIQHIRDLNDITRILVSHDMGLVRQCDRIVVLSKESDGDEASPGVVEAVGTHEELLLSSPTYQRFFQSQAGRFSDAR